MQTPPIQNHLIQSKPIRLSVFILGCVMALVSMVCSVILWLSFANNITDTILAFITAASLVAIAYIFVPVLARLKQLKKWGLFAFIFILEAILITSSLAATIGWLESNYQNNYQKNITSSTGFKHNQQAIENLTTQINLLNALAKDDQASKKYRGRALRTLQKANTLTDKRNALMQQPTNNTANNSAHTLAHTLGPSRFAGWFILAVLVDGCPMACFAVLGAQASRQKNIKPEDTTDTILTATPIKKAAPAQQDTTALTTNTATTTIKNTDHIYTEIAQEIKAGHWGDKPAMRKIITDKKIRHTQAKQIFERLVSENKLIQVGTRFERVA